ALANLETAVARARGRLEAALAFMGAKLGELTQSCNEIAAGIEAEVIAATPEPSNPPAVAQDTPAAAEAAAVPPAVSTLPEGTQTQEKGNATEADGIDLSERAEVANLGTDGGTVGTVNRVADL